jgi:hypothetical protein
MESLQARTQTPTQAPTQAPTQTPPSSTIQELILQQYPPKKGLQLASLSISNFRLFKQLSIKHITEKHVIMGANGSGKTSVLWGIILLLRAYDAMAPDSQI